MKRLTLLSSPSHVMTKEPKESELTSSQISFKSELLSVGIRKIVCKQGIVVLIYNPRICGQKQEDLEFKSSLSCITILLLKERKEDEYESKEKKKRSEEEKKKKVRKCSMKCRMWNQNAWSKPQKPVYPRLAALSQ